MAKRCISCHELGGIVIDYREGNITCTYCGEVQEHRIIDETLETRTFAKDSSSFGGEALRRVGGANNELLSDQGIGTVIGESASGYNGLSRSAYRSAQSSADRTLMRGFETINHYIHHLNLNDEVEEEAKKIFKVISEQNSLKGRPHEAIVAACIFNAAKIKKKARNLKQVATHLALDMKDLKKCHSVVSKFYKDTTPELQESNVISYGRTLANSVNFPPKLQRDTGEVGKRAISLGIVTGKNPMSIASAAVYIVGIANPGHRRTMNDISQFSEMKDITIKNCAKIMLERKYEILRGICSEEAIKSLEHIV